MSKEVESVYPVEEAQLLRCRFYENVFPEPEEVVMVNVTEIGEMGAYVTLLEYDNIEGMILLSELSRRASYTTNRQRMGPGNSALSSTRLTRPGHADHAPKLFEQTTNTTNLNMEEKESQLQLQRSFFQFSSSTFFYTSFWDFR